MFPGPPVASGLFSAGVCPWEALSFACAPAGEEDFTPKDMDTKIKPTASAIGSLRETLLIAGIVILDLMLFTSFTFFRPFKCAYE